MRHLRHRLSRPTRLLANLSPGRQPHPPPLPHLRRIQPRWRHPPGFSGRLHDLDPFTRRAGLLFLAIRDQGWFSSAVGVDGLAAAEERRSMSSIWSRRRSNFRKVALTRAGKLARSICGTSAAKGKAMRSKFRAIQTGLLCLVLAAATSGKSAATFTDANWISMGGLPGADGDVYAVAVDGLGNLYIGGSFTVVGDVL